MATRRTSRTGPATPVVPAALRAVDPAEHRLEDEADWWQLESVSGDYTATAADNFHIEQCRFDRGDFTGGAWLAGTWRDCRFQGVNLAGVSAERCTMLRSSVDHARGTGLQWMNGVMKDVTFTGCRLDLAGFRFTRMEHVEFHDCRMSGVDFTNADLSGARFVDCDLTGAKLHHAKAVGARFQRCTLDDVTGVEALNGATVAAADLVPLTFTLARALGITIESAGDHDG